MRIRNLSVSQLFYTILIVAALNSCYDPPRNLYKKVWTDEDRSFLVSGLERSFASLEGSIEDLNEEQWYFKVDSASWSIADVPVAQL